MKAKKWDPKNAFSPLVAEFEKFQMEVSCEGAAALLLMEILRLRPASPGDQTFRLDTRAPHIPLLEMVPPYPGQQVGT